MLRKRSRSRNDQRQGLLRLLGIGFSTLRQLRPASAERLPSGPFSPPTPTGSRVRTLGESPLVELVELQKSAVIHFQLVASSSL
jgi:hypothetical protein